MALIETPEQRGARFMRLASEAAETAAKITVPLIRLRYLELSETLKAEAQHVLDESSFDLHPHSIFTHASRHSSD